MDFDAQGVYADLDGVIYFLRLPEGIGSRWRLLNYDLNFSTTVWAFALVPMRTSTTRLLVLQGLLCVAPLIYPM